MEEDGGGLDDGGLVDVDGVVEVGGFLEKVTDGGGTDAGEVGAGEEVDGASLIWEPEEVLEPFLPLGRA